MHYTRNNTCIHANHIREYQSQPWNGFSGLRTLQTPLIQTATLCKTVHGAISIPKFYISRRRDRRKNQSTAQIPEHINQTAANQSNDPLFPRRFRKSDIRFRRNVTKLEFKFSNQGNTLAMSLLPILISASFQISAKKRSKTVTSPNVVLFLSIWQSC